MAMYDAAEAEAGSLPPAKPPLEAAQARSASDGTLPPALEWLTKLMDEQCGADLNSRRSLPEN